MTDSTTPIITLATDFGVTDWFVGSMKGAILSVCPDAVLVDITHAIPRHDVKAGALALMASVPYFPQGTIHLAVIDPGVGTDRRAVAVKAGGSFFVAPDNGVLSYCLDGQDDKVSVVLPSDGEGISPTFHGRDIFGPAAGRLAAGVPIENLGPVVDDLNLWPFPRPQRMAPGHWRGEILHVDTFGNLITNLGQEILPDLNQAQARGSPIQIQAGSHTIQGLSQTYADAPQGQLIALWGSLGLLELAINQGNAAAQTALLPGAPVEIRG